MLTKPDNWREIDAHLLDRYETDKAMVRPHFFFGGVPNRQYVRPMFEVLNDDELADPAIYHHDNAVLVTQ